MCIIITEKHQNYISLKNEGYTNIQIRHLQTTIDVEKRLKNELRK